MALDSRPAAGVVFFERREIDQLLRLYGRMVAAGEWRDYGMKVVVDAETRQILGAAILGLNGDEAVHGLIDLMYAKAPYTVIQRAVHIHPTVSELIPTMLGELKALV